ncbi:MAG: Crp/Fnr family transcriptional regulator [Blautia sp.]|jgi:CRP/FNR family transcriptional regulator
MNHSVNMQKFLEELPFWKQLSDPSKALLRDGIQSIQYPAGAQVASTDSDCLGTLFVQKGIMRVYLLSEDGKEATIYRLHPGEVCVLTASCLISGITFDVQIDAETACDTLLIPSRILSVLMEENVYVENYVYKLTTEHFSKVISAMERIFFLSLRQRIAAFLIDESAEQNTNTLSITQEQMARAIGSAREAVSRTLKQMTKEGILDVTRGGLQILDKSRLYQDLSI